MKKVISHERAKLCLERESFSLTAYKVKVMPFLMRHDYFFTEYGWFNIKSFYANSRIKGSLNRIEMF